MLKNMEKPVLAIVILIGYLYNFATAQFYFPNEAAAVPNYGRCLTPNGERALCIGLQDCKYLYNLLITPPLKDSDRNYLTRSQCGYINRKVLICCPDRYRIKKPPPPTTTAKPMPTNLLPKPGQCGPIFLNRIYGGKATKIDEYPWMALIEYTKPGNKKGHHCGGSLINARYVITASHCVNGKGLPTDWKLSGVRLGEWDTTTEIDCETDLRGEEDCSPPHMDVPVEKVIPHPDYDPNSKSQINDLALLRLNRNIPYTDFIRPICLPVNDDLKSATFDGISMEVSGWGKTESVSASTIKLKANVTVLPLKKCHDTYMTQGIELQNSQMCAGGTKGIDSCRGDSGGPLIGTASNQVINYNFLGGVVSFGPTPCGLEGWPGVYTRVGHFIDWIKEELQP